MWAPAAASSFLALDVRQVKPARLRAGSVDRRLDRRRIALAAQVRDRFSKVPHGDGLDPRKRGFRRTFRRAQELLKPAATSAFGSGEHAADRSQASVQAELADGSMLRDAFRRHLPRGGQNGKGDRQVESRAFLAQLGRRQVDRDAMSWPLQLRGGNPAAHAMLRLLAGAVSQAYERECRQAVLKVRLDVDPARVEPDQRMRDRSCEHVANIGNKQSRVCDANVTKA